MYDDDNGDSNDDNNDDDDDDDETGFPSEDPVESQWPATGEEPRVVEGVDEVPTNESNMNMMPLWYNWQR